MTRFQRIKNIFTGLLMLLLCLLLAVNPEQNYTLVLFLLSLSLLLYGIRKLFYYFTMAIHMVGGRMVLYESIIFLEFGLFMIALIQMPLLYAMLYTMVARAFKGLVEILHGMETRKMQSPHWKKNMLRGICNVLACLVCFLFINSPEVMVYIYCLTLTASACNRIASSFRKTAVIYIQ